ncbi:hypothetical protein ON010_g17905 [Phytophthora cinnamomi]|nr:hypothetical protein ON010_g17905 [Phytophthora cinnamomi]
MLKTGHGRRMTAHGVGHGAQERRPGRVQPLRLRAPTSSRMHAHQIVIHALAAALPRVAGGGGAARSVSVQYRTLSQHINELVGRFGTAAE